MCEGWILDTVRTTQNKIESEKLFSYTLYVVSTALFTAQNTYALLVGLVEGFPCADTMVETMYCEACHYVSQLIFLLCPFPVDHSIGNVKTFLYRVPFAL